MFRAVLINFKLILQSFTFTQQLPSRVDIHFLALLQLSKLSIIEFFVIAYVLTTFWAESLGHLMHSGLLHTFFWTSLVREYRPSAKLILKLAFLSVYFAQWASIWPVL